MRLPCLNIEQLVSSFFPCQQEADVFYHFWEVLLELYIYRTTGKLNFDAKPQGHIPPSTLYYYFLWLLGEQGTSQQELPGLITSNTQYTVSTGQPSIGRSIFRVWVTLCFLDMSGTKICNVQKPWGYLSSLYSSQHAHWEFWMFENLI